MNFYIGDLHFGHEKIMEYDNRPFPSLGEMANIMLRNWNNAVGLEDDVYILGDVHFGKDWDMTNKFMELANGNKHLIRGNHDHRLNEDFKKQMVEITDYKEIKDNGQKLILCHYPIAHWNGQSFGSIHLYAHVHTMNTHYMFMEYVKMCNANGVKMECYNVGCMMPYMNYTPRTLKQIREAQV